jgi:hypothetical protein
MNFMSYNLENGSKLCVFNVMDDYVREGIAIEFNQPLPCTRSLEHVIAHCASLR